MIVTNHAGRPLTRQTFHPYWREAVEKAGVDPDARFHDLRGFYTRTLATSGNHEPKTVQRLSRPARFEETWDTYAETGAGAEEVKVTAFSSAFTATGDDDTTAAAGEPPNSRDRGADHRLYMATCTSICLAGRVRQR